MIRWLFILCFFFYSGPQVSLKRRFTANLTLCYFLSKLFYLLNIIFQLYLLNEFLHEEFFDNFHRVLVRLLSRGQVEESNLFPLISKCLFYNNIDDVLKGEFNRKEHLCTLPLNLYNDRLFFSVALLLFVMMFAVVWSSCQWAAMLFLPSYKDSLIKKVLREEFKEDDEDPYLDRER